MNRPPRKKQHPAPSPSTAGRLKDHDPSARPEGLQTDLAKSAPLPTCLIPGEFEPQEALVFGCSGLVWAYPQLFVDFVRAAHERIQLVGIVEEKLIRLAELLLSAAGLPRDAVEFLIGDTSSIWARDWSPLCGYDREGRRCQYLFAMEHMRNRDDLVARNLFQKRFPGAVEELPLSMEGGNFLCNGAGLVVTSSTLLQSNLGRNYGGKEIASLFENRLGGSQWASLLPLAGERTGHVDLFATFLQPDFLLLGSVKESEDARSHQLLNDAAEKLNGLPTRAGKLRVERIPMPDSSDTYFRSYNNVIFANGLLLVPNYPNRNAKLDRLVLDMYREFLPGWEVVGLDLGDLAMRGGGLHCLSTNVPPARRSGYHGGASAAKAKVAAS